MNDAAPRELELTPALIDYARAIALQEAEERCPKYVVYDDVVQEVLLHLISKPPKYDPAKGASEKTLIHTIIQRGVLKYVARQCKHAGRFKQAEETGPDKDREPKGKLLEPRAGTAAAREKMLGLLDAEAADDALPRVEQTERRADEVTTKGLATDDVLEFIDNEESRELCRQVIECKGNMSAAARRLGVSEGTIRYRLKLLAPKLIAAGFNPFGMEEIR